MTVQSLTASRKRYLAGAWFAAFALLSLALFFHQLTFARGGVFLFMVLPTIAGGLAGALWGGRILEGAKTSTVRQSMLTGIAVAAGAFVIFSLLYAVALPFAERGWSLRQSGGLFLLTFTLGSLLAAPIVLLGGMLAGATLYQFGRKVIS